MTKISTTLPEELKKAKWFTEASGDKTGMSYVEIDIVRTKRASNYGCYALARITNADVEYYSGEQGKMTVKAYHESARDCDHWLARVFNADIEDLQIGVLAYGRSEYYGYLTDLHAYEAGKGPDVKDEDEECYCGEKHGYVDSFLPPPVFGESKNGFGSPSPRLLVRVTVYPTKAFKVVVDKN